MRLLYNGISIELLSFDRFERENVYDPSQTDLLYVRWTIGATGVYSAGGFPVGTAVKTKSADTQVNLTGYTISPTGRPARGTPPTTGETTGTSQESNTQSNSRGFNALITDVELRYRLCLPRRELLITATDAESGGNIILLHSPKTGYVCDPINGPKPHGPPDIIDVSGDGTTFGVHFQIETATLPNPDKSDQLLLSHRWQMSHAHDENYYCIRKVEGQAIFNAALLESQALEPDWFRNQLFHPIPLGFKREDIHVDLSPDGTTLHYSFLDRDTPITFDAGDSGATQMSIVEKLRYVVPSVSRILEGE